MSGMDEWLPLQECKLPDCPYPSPHRDLKYLPEYSPSVKAAIIASRKAALEGGFVQTDRPDIKSPVTPCPDPRIATVIQAGVLYGTYENCTFPVPGPY